MSPEDTPVSGSAAEGEQPAEEPGEQSGAPAADGLDLARAAMRAARAAGGAPARRRRPGAGGPGGPDATRRGGRTTPGAWSGPRPDERDPQPLGGEIARLVSAGGWELDLRVRGIFARWAEIVGAEIAEHARPESFADGVLVLRTDSTAWATQLRLLLPTLLVRINDALGAGTVTVVEVQGPRGPTWKRGPRSARDGRGPRDTYG
ncbi:DUF721 domain-containing protein [Nocardioides sp.]|uniref:DUF721 domain-containing protein n=1 Tax=Nocardioides sp. TaxID=35761 RepID=UPI003514204C